MEKLKWMLVAMTLTTVPVVGQPTDKEGQKEVEIEVERNRVIIEAKDMQDLAQLDLNQIVREVAKRSQMLMKQHQEMLANVDRQLANGEITEEQAEEMREMINDRTEESMETIGRFMEAWGDQYEERMELWEKDYEAKIRAWEAEVEARSQNSEFVVPPLPPLPPVPAPPAPGNGTTEEEYRKIIINEEGITIHRGKDGKEPFALRFEEEKEKDKQQKSTKKIDRTEGYFDIHFGFNQQMEGGRSFLTEGSEELIFWKSTAFELGLGAKTRLGSPVSKLYLKYGGEVSWHNFRLTDNNLIMQGNDRVVFGENPLYTNVGKTKYHVAYVNVPLMLQLDFSDVGQRDESFTLGLGGYAGVRINSKREVEYRNNPYNEVEEKAKTDFFMNQFRYGVMGQIGFGSFKITGKYDLNSFFQPNKGPDYQMAAIMIGFTL